MAGAASCGGGLGLSGRRGGGGGGGLLGGERGTSLGVGLGLVSEPAGGGGSNERLRWRRIETQKGW
jgi:hypothetical protein